jgi:hypothetical protein
MKDPMTNEFKQQAKSALKATHSPRVIPKNKSKVLALITVVAFLAAVWDSLPKRRRKP